MKITAAQLRRIIKEEAKSMIEADDRSSLQRRQVAGNISDTWASITGPQLWLALFEDPSFQAAVQEWKEANSGTMDMGVAGLQSFVEDSDVSVEWNSTTGGGHSQRVTLTHFDGLKAVYEGKKWTVS